MRNAKWLHGDEVVEWPAARRLDGAQFLFFPVRFHVGLCQEFIDDDDDRADEQTCVCPALFLTISRPFLLNKSPEPSATVFMCT